MSLLPALVVGLVVVLGLGFNPLGSETSQLGEIPSKLIEIFLVAWPVFSLVYLLWTHVGLQEVNETELTVHARWAMRRKRRWWARFFSNGGAVSPLRGLSGRSGPKNA